MIKFRNRRGRRPHLVADIPAETDFYKIFVANFGGRPYASHRFGFINKEELYQKIIILSQSKLISDKRSVKEILEAFGFYANE